MEKEKVKPELIVFDVYETLLDMQEVVRKVNALLDSRRGYTIWFEMFMQYCFVDNCTSKFNEFGAIAKATMQMAANTLGTSIEEEEIKDAMGLLKHLSVNDGVQEGFSILSSSDLRIAALTNSSKAALIERMERTGLISYFERVFNAEEIKKYKPCPDVYLWALKELGVEPAKALMVSAHGWDIAGAANAGMQTAYLKQGKQMLYPLAPSPDYTCVTIEDLARQLTGQNS